ncbi:hypothetical protein CRYUN_Cryun07bG0095500 [Craigia yunnanensis]
MACWSQWPFSFFSFLFLLNTQASQQVAKHPYDSKLQPSTLLTKQVDNMYAASLYAAFASLLQNKHNSLAGKRVVMFSYGSGLTATIFSLKLQDDQHPFNLLNIATVMKVSDKLKVRHEFPPEKFVDTMKLMESDMERRTLSRARTVTSYYQVPTTSLKLTQCTEDFTFRRLMLLLPFCQPVRIVLLANAT